MKATPPALASALLMAGFSIGLANETAIQPQIESVGLFKNGVAVVRASFTVPGPGSYRWDNIPQTIHGTFAVDSDAVLTTRATHRMVDKAPGRMPGPLWRGHSARRHSSAWYHPKHSENTVEVRCSEGGPPPPGAGSKGRAWVAPEGRIPPGRLISCASLAPAAPEVPRHLYLLSACIKRGIG